MLFTKLKDLSVVLGSQSPRRHELLKSIIDIEFQVIVRSIDESVPDHIKPEEAAAFIALKKADAFKESSFSNHLVITADTVVVDAMGRILGKPAHREEAKSILSDLSGNTHIVYTGVCLLLNESVNSFTCMTEVVFNTLSKEEIDFYVERYQPYDKAGSYGIQEWIGRIGIKEIKGSYENVMGLPTSRLYQELTKIEKGL